MPKLIANRRYPKTRMRRMRSHDFSRRLMAENHVTVNDLVYPLFVIEGKQKRMPVTTMPGVDRLSIDLLVEEAKQACALGVPAVMLFPYLDHSMRTEMAEEAYNPDGLVQRAIKAVKQACPELGVMTDVALDPFTTHGQDGIVNANNEVDNETTIEVLIKQALSHIRAGADVVAPSDMMDGRIGRIREAFEKEGMINAKILAHSSKYASSFYGPFREAVGSNKTLGKADKFTYQMSPNNIDEAMQEVALDLEEGADIVMVKPGLMYLDVLHRVKERFKVPTFVYQISGEYAMIKAAVASKALADERACVMETLLAFKRAGADAVVTYFAKQVAEWLNE
ncbi:MAG: porphobilinogen synthase [Gammaproteobacteria bacterium]